ncbi:GntR family transcriptional regulator [Pseudonocardia sp. KRD-184]|uniref:GntR family transcriptional regulator n=1 Tax=Pseudonocardia oceani TaxID=2792013 RepID=A0ABS6U509_9PSEU|nr:GntR family transcriptional regulator [Pseudonocardia oceani]MBW0090703.1 GntR family transcriptional regulator [Pseudonocardia oceani]MBW0097609.1 GntR family transcriptional regulator [Pseudonocardia oceani]MBW0124332.1 GntR family transcriptional regulator [Pseudonocardia oceani]MBW0127078.1 GntR family transcriptional regulator [Pseudonocardia oceani]
MTAPEAGPRYPRLRQRTLADEVAGILRQMILAGELSPGWRMTQNKLADLLQVSITPVREALVTLTAQGLLEASPNRSFTVARIGADDVRDVYWQLATLSGELTRRACLHRDDDLVAELHTAEAEHSAAVRAEDPVATDTANLRLHRALNLAASAPRLLFMLRTALRFIPDALYGQVPGWGARAVEAHAVIVTAVSAGYSDAAARAASEHVRQAGEVLVDVLQARGFWDPEVDDDASVHALVARAATTRPL